MQNHRLLVLFLLTAGKLGVLLRAAEFESGVDNDWFRAWPPAGVSYLFPFHHSPGRRTTR